MNLPNKLTIARVVLVPIFIAVYMLNFHIAATIIFIVASLTDMLDGQIARKQNIVTNFGKIMDPLADKILTYSAFCLFVEEQLMPAWMLVVILAREFVVSGMRTVAASEGLVIAAGFSGKLKTVLQMIAIPGILIYISLPAGLVQVIIYYIAYITLWASLVMTVYSGTEYVIKNRNVFRM